MQKNNNPITKKELVETLGEFAERVIFPGVENIINRRIKPLEKSMGGMEKSMDGMEKRMDGMEKRMENDKNEILNSDDKLIKELLIMRSEIAAHTKSYHDLDERISYLEKVNVLMLKKLELAPNT